MFALHQPLLGVALRDETHYEFCVWAPNAETVALHLISPEDKLIPMQADSRSYWSVQVENVKDALYMYRIDDRLERPDPASRYQPQGPHGPSQVIDINFEWSDQTWVGIPLEDYLLYELHVGTFTAEGTFDAIIPYFDELRDLGITAIEIMPIAQFPGERNWGYDGVNIFAVQNSYGGPDSFKRLIDACHRKGLAVILDVVYNHFGAEGNYLHDYGPYFTKRYQTPWGDAVNFDGTQSDEVRNYFIQNALFWITEYHVDGLRLDATHAYIDLSSRTFLQELAEAVHQRARELNRRVYLIAENDKNDARIVTPQDVGGYGLDAQYSDDFHHALHTLLTGENAGYYQGYGQLEHLKKAFREGFVYSGDYSTFHQRRHGTSARHLPGDRFVVCSQNHDQTGNRCFGERLTSLTSFEGLKLAAGTVLLSPYIPLLFMGEEYAETAPFLYFISHTDDTLIEAVCQGRKQEFAAFLVDREPPDPQAEETFLTSKLDHSLKRRAHHYVLLQFYKELINLRKSISALRPLNKHQMEVIGYEKARVLFVRRWDSASDLFMFFNYCGETAQICLPVAVGKWRKQIDSTDEKWRAGTHPGVFAQPLASLLSSDGEITVPVSAYSFAVFARE